MVDVSPLALGRHLQKGYWSGMTLQILPEPSVGLRNR
jgi:hypothetical protein